MFMGTYFAQMRKVPSGIFYEIKRKISLFTTKIILSLRSDNVKTESGYFSTFVLLVRLDCSSLYGIPKFEMCVAKFTLQMKFEIIRISIRNNSRPEVLGFWASSSIIDTLLSRLSVVSGKRFRTVWHVVLKKMVGREGGMSGIIIRNDDIKDNLRVISVEVVVSCNCFRCFEYVQRMYDNMLQEMILSAEVPARRFIDWYLFVVNFSWMTKAGIKIQIANFINIFNTQSDMSNNY